MPILGPAGTAVFVDTSRVFHFGSRVAPHAPHFWYDDSVSDAVLVHAADVGAGVAAVGVSFATVSVRQQLVLGA